MNSVFTSFKTELSLSLYFDQYFFGHPNFTEINNIILMLILAFMEYFRLDID